VNPIFSAISIPYLFLDLLQKLNIFRVPSQVSGHLSPDRTIEKVEIADEIENFVTGKLV
jgi:hypothetical protein